MREELLSSSEVATLLGVSATSVKRWADEGLLPCVKTAGRHRRFTRAAVDQFRAAHTVLTDGGANELESWMYELTHDGPPQALQGRLLRLRAEQGSWAAAGDTLGGVLTELGARWATGRITIVDEHLASERIARGLARMAEWMPLDVDAPRALLAVPEGDEHTLGLSLVELVLRELGWATLWAGRRLPTAELLRAIESQRVDLVVLSASAVSADRATLTELAERVGELCERRGAGLAVGGSGAWPERLRYGVVVRSCVALRDALLKNERK